MGYQVGLLLMDTVGVAWAQLSVGLVNVPMLLLVACCLPETAGAARARLSCGGVLREVRSPCRARALASGAGADGAELSSSSASLSLSLSPQVRGAFGEQYAALSRMLGRNRHTVLLLVAYFNVYVVTTGVYNFVLFWGEVKYNWSPGDSAWCDTPPLSRRDVSHARS